MMPNMLTLVEKNMNELTPSKRKTVLFLQFGDSFVKTPASRAINNISTSVSVLHVVSAIQTSPLDDIAAMMFTF